MANELEKILLRDSQRPTPGPEDDPVSARLQRKANFDSQFVSSLGPDTSGRRGDNAEMVFGAKEYFRRGLRAGSEQVQGSFDGIAAIGNLLAGEDEAAQRRLNLMQQHDEQIQNVLAPLENFEEFLDEPNLTDAFKQFSRAVGQFTYPAALTIGEALAGGIIASSSRAAFTSAGRAALKDTLTKTTRKVGNLRANRVLEPERGLAGQVDELGPTVNPFEELWFKTLRNKGVDNLTPEEKVVMDASRKYLQDMKRGGLAGAFIASETMIAPEILREYQEAGMELTANEALMALLVGVPTSGIEVLGEAVFFGSLFKLAVGGSRLKKAQQRAALGQKISKQDLKAIQLARLAELKGIKAIGAAGQRYLKKYEKLSTLQLARDVGRVALASSLVEGTTELLQEEFIMSQAQLNNPTFNIQGAEARLRRAQAFFDGAAAGGARGTLGGVSAAVFRQARDLIVERKDDAEWQNIQNETYGQVADLGLPEVKEDIFAQLNTMVDPDYKREAVWLPIETLRKNGLLDETGEEILVNREALQQFLLEAYQSEGRSEADVPEIHMSIDKDGAGVLLSVNPELNSFYNNQRFKDKPLRDVLTQILDFAPTPDASTGNEVVVQLLENDRVVWEQTTPPEQVPEVVLKADEQYKKDDKYNVIKTQIEESVTPEQLELDLVTPEQEVVELGNTIEQLEDIVLEKMANNDDYTADLEELERKRKEQKKRQVVIKSIEEVAEDRIEANKTDEDIRPKYERVRYEQKPLSTEQAERIRNKARKQVGDSAKTVTSRTYPLDADLIEILENFGIEGARLYINEQFNKAIENINADTTLSEDRRTAAIAAIEDARQRELNDERLQTPSEDPIIRNMAEEEDKTPADIEAELNKSFAEAGVTPVTAKELTELGIRPEDLANVDVIGQTTLVTGRKADVFKSIDEATINKLSEKAANELRNLRADAQSFVVSAELTNSGVFYEDSAGELSKINEQFEVLNEELDKKTFLFEQLTSPTNDIKRKLNELAYGQQRVKTSEPDTTEQPGVRVKRIKKGEKTTKPTFQVDRTYGAFDQETFQLAVSRDNFLSARYPEYKRQLNKLKKRIKELRDLRDNLEQQRTEALSKAKPAPPSSPTRLSVESLLLDEIGVPKQRRQAILQGSSVEFLRELNRLNSQLEERTVTDDTGFVLGEEAKDKIRSMLHKEALEIKLNNADISAEDAKRLSREKILEEVEVGGVPLRQFGVGSGPAVRSVLADYIEEAEVSLVDPEILKANSSILKAFITAQEQDPNSVYKIASTPVIIPGKNNIFNTAGFSKNAILILGPTGPQSFLTSSADNSYPIQQTLGFLNQLNELVKTKAIPTVVLEERFGANVAKELLAFVKANQQELGLTIEEGYQAIFKQRTAESRPEIYNEKFAGMAPSVAVQTAVTTALQSANLNNKTGTTNIRENNQIYNPMGSKESGKVFFTWVKRTYNGQTPNEQVLSFNDVLAAGTAIFDTKLDSIEKGLLPYSYRIALGFSTMLEQKLLSNFEDKNGKPAEIVFKYDVAGRKKPKGEVVINSLTQKLPEELTDYLNPDDSVPIFSAAKIAQLSTPKLVAAASDEAQVKELLSDEKASRFDLLNLPVYYDNASKTYKSAKDLAANNFLTPFYEKQQKLRRPNIIRTILDLEKKIMNPNISDLDPAAGRDLSIEQYSSKPIYSKEELDQRVQALYRDKYALPNKLVPAFNLSDLVLDKIITGGQIGVDMAGARVAKKYNLKQSVFVASYPKEFGADRSKGRTLVPEIRALFPDLENTPELKNLKAEEKFLKDLFKENKNEVVVLQGKSGFKARTELVVKASDGLILFAETDGKMSPGSALTQTLAEQNNVPFLVNPKTPQEIISFLTTNKVKNLNIAGAGESAPSFIKKLDYEKILDDTFSLLAPLIKTKKDGELYKTAVTAREKYVAAAIKNPELYFFPSLEDKVEILETIAKEEDILTQDDYSKEALSLSEMVGDEEGKLDKGMGVAESGAFGDEAAEPFDFIRQKSASTYNPKLIRQNINGETISGRVGAFDGPGVFIEDRVNSQYRDLATAEGEGVGREILSLLRNRGRTPAQNATLNRLKRIGGDFPDISDLVELRNIIANDQGFKLTKAAQLVDPIKTLTDIAVQTLSLQNRKIYVMFANKPIIFDDPALNKKIQSLIHDIPEGKEVSFIDDVQRPETMMIYKGLDIIVLKSPTTYTSLLNATLKKTVPEKNLQLELAEVEGIVLASLLHAYGHSFFHEYHKGRIDPSTELGRALMDEHATQVKDPNVPAQYKSKHGFEEKIADSIAQVITKQATTDLSTRQKAYAAGVIAKMKKYYNTSKSNFIKRIIGRVVATPSNTIEKLVTEVAEDFAGTYRDRGSGVQESFRFAEELKNEDPILRDMKDEDFEKALDDIAKGDLKDVNKFVKRTKRTAQKYLSSNINYLEAIFNEPEFIKGIYRQTQTKGAPGFIQAKDTLYNTIITGLLQPLLEELNLPPGSTFFGMQMDDNEVSPAGRAALVKVFNQYAVDMQNLDEDSIAAQVKDPNYEIPSNEYAISSASKKIYDIERRVKIFMENAGLPTRNNFDLTRHYNIDLISNSSHARNALIFLLEEYNGDLEKGAAAKVVDEMLYNREALEFLEKDGIEANPMVASLAVGMSPSRKKYFENIPTAALLNVKGLDEEGLLTNIVDSQIHGLRSIMNKVVFNEKIRYRVSDAQILVARDLVAKGTYANKTGSVKTNHLEFLAETETRIEQRQRLNENNKGLQPAEQLQFDEEKYNLRGWRAATAAAWVGNNRDPIEATAALNSIFGKAGMSINTMPNLRNFQAAAALLNQVTFLPLSALSTLPELVGPAIQRGGLEGLGMTIKATMQQFQNKEEVNDMVRAMGQFGLSQSVESSLYAGDLAWMTDTTAAYSKLFFKTIFITKLMNFVTRNASLVGLYAIKTDAKRGNRGDLKAIERLNLINLTPAEAQYALDKINFFSGSPKTFEQYDKAFRTDPTTIKLRDGLNSLVTEMILKPNAAQRTQWMNNPFFAIFAQLKPFYYSFGKVFGENVYQNAKREYKYNGTIGALTPLLLILATMLPLAMLGLELRELVKYIAQGGNPEVFRSDDMDWPTYMLDIADRAGLPGRYGLLIPMFEADLYGDTFFTPLLGPTPERIIDIIEGDGNVWDYVPYFGAFGYD